jgi:hypothetical protein
MDLHDQYDFMSHFFLVLWLTFNQSRTSSQSRSIEIHMHFFLNHFVPTAARVIGGEAAIPAPAT